ncbi:MAG TPA: multicopper oxidase domain-containing protein [Gemmatimonadales bacterium]|nr:multicopper oxidase domain-containing protein [Gemmatimonadales bacterium]
MMHARAALLGGFAAVPLAAAAGWLALRPAAPPGVTRTYYIAADEVDWDYAPTGTDRITGKPFEGMAKVLVTSGSARIGRVYRKAIYREYTDSTFTALKPRPAQWEHLGILGPLLRGVVGDTMRVVFRNHASHPYSMHPHGVFYRKDSEGAPYDDGTVAAAKDDDGVPPGGTHVYTWPVPVRAGPAPGEGSSIVWMYHSHVSETKDVNAGLMGPMIVTARSAARPDGTPDDVDRELVVAFAEMDENVSWYFEDNIKRYAGEPAKVPRDVSFADPAYLINLRETINGFSFGHTPGLTVQLGERVRWYVFASTNFEIHTPHWHGQTVVSRHMRTDLLNLFTMEMAVADMVPDNPGVWLFHCHVAPHLDAGMQALFTVTEAVATR